jgi:hypothetical protein
VHLLLVVVVAAGQGCSSEEQAGAGDRQHA